MQKKNNKILLSGIQSTGRLHIGNYFGAMKKFVDWQEKYDTYISLVNYHALTTVQDGKTLRDNTLEAAIDHLAIGLDPEKATLFKQSDVPEVTELTWIFDCLITMPYLSRAHAFKEKTAKGIEASVGLFNYPVLMASDILIVDGEIVPVGKDQEQHVEMARDIAKRFNKIFGKTFREPEAYIETEVAVVPGTDGQKMSKSYGNTIPLFGTDEEIEKAVMGIVTDSKGVDDPKDPEKCNVFAIHKLVTPADELEKLRTQYNEGKIGYGDSKKLLLKSLLSYFKPMKERREKYEKDPKLVEKILQDGGDKARKRAHKKMETVREKVGLT